MILKLFGIILPCATTLYLTYSYFRVFYTSEIPILCFLCALSAVISLVFTIPAAKNGSTFKKLAFFVVPYFTLYVFLYNYLFAAIIAIFCGVCSVVFSKRKKCYTKLLFCDDNIPFCVKYNLKPGCGGGFNFFTGMLSVFVTVLFVCTVVFTSPSVWWQRRIFPINTEKTEILGAEAVPCGNVTSAVWYDKSALYVHEFFDVPVSSGTLSPCREAGIKTGDIITHINGEAAASSDFIKQGSDGSDVIFDVVRPQNEGEPGQYRFCITPAYSIEDEKYFVGMTYTKSAPVATSVQTLSFVYPETGYFAATAHSADALYPDGDALVGRVYFSRTNGRDDEGLTIGAVYDEMGVILATCDYGAFGRMLLPKTNAVPIAEKSEVKTGKAVLLSDFEGGDVTEYDVYVTGRYRIDNRDVMCLAVTDKRIISQGGITRGMSGSPIVHNGKIIGALSNMDSGGTSAYATYAYDMAHELLKASKNFDTKN